MRRNARTDRNHAEIVKALRTIGCSVQSLAPIGRGCPDLLVGKQGINLVLEVKDGAKPPSARKLTPDEEVWRLNWKGQYHVVEDIQGAVNTVQMAIAMRQLTPNNGGAE